MHIFRQLIPDSWNPEGFRRFARLYSFVRVNALFCHKIDSFYLNPELRGQLDAYSPVLNSPKVNFAANINLYLKR